LEYSNSHKLIRLLLIAKIVNLKCLIQYFNINNKLIIIKLNLKKNCIMSFLALTNYKESWVFIFIILVLAHFTTNRCFPVLSTQHYIRLTIFIISMCTVGSCKFVFLSSCVTIVRQVWSFVLLKFCWNWIHFPDPGNVK